MPKQPNKKKQTSKKEVAVNDVKKDGLQVHFGNLEVVKLRLLESISKNTAELLREFRDIVKEIKEKK